ncbi:MAG TPA: NUDIX domain-containing protein [Acidimicrobiales bacterium]|nr:NUDIX domain-containing protein [Acidimicrobiales bacterium]
MSAAVQPKRQWVVGFLLDTDAEMVVLIRKNRPRWQLGRLNGVGGKVEPGETLDAAMRREFTEETGVYVQDWHHFATLTWEEGLVHFFRSFKDPIVLERCRTMTDESVERHRVHTLNMPGPGATSSPRTCSGSFLSPPTATTPTT